MFEVITWGLENLNLLKFFDFLCFSHPFFSPFLLLSSGISLKGEKMFPEGRLENERLIHRNAAFALVIEVLAYFSWEFLLIPAGS